ncbi:MAG: serine/threonine protein phosphatase [Bacteroidales bacterium]|nr:serine/threonine protein phosphatase [Bacteroidales bacterium]
MNKRIFAIGDIHGCFESFRELVESKINLQVNDKLILLGDYIDRGSQSKAVVDYIIKLQHKGFDIIPLMGNHESMLLDAIINGERLSIWIYNGGSKTLESFSIKSLKDLDSIYIDFFKGLRFYYAYKNFLFVHAGFNDETDNPFGDQYSMIWQCREKYLNPALIDKIIIHGHCLVTVANCKKRVQANHQVIDLDTGCVFSDMVGYGSLTALELNTMQLYDA